MENLVCHQNVNELTLEFNILTTEVKDIYSIQKWLNTGHPNGISYIKSFVPSILVSFFLFFTFFFPSKLQKNGVLKTFNVIMR